MADTLSITISAGTAVLIVEAAWRYISPRLAKSSPDMHKTFADDPQRYWENMEHKVTKPLAAVLEKQTDVLNEVLLAMAEERGRSNRRRR